MSVLSKSILASALAGALTLTNASATLIGYWPMNETEGDVAAPAIGTVQAVWQNAGNNLTWTAGEIDGAADLGGASGNNFFAVDLSGVLSESEGLTIALWVNPDQFTGTNYEGLFMTRGANPGIGGTAMGNQNWGLAWQNGTGGDGAASSGHLDSRTGGAGRSAADTIQPNTWYHVALVWDGVNGTHVQYINGVASDATGTATGPVGNISGGVWHIGKDNCCGNREFDGQVDDVAVWNEALPAAEILALFDKTKSPSAINPPTDNDEDGLPNDYEDMFPGFLDKDTPDADQDVDRVGGVIGGALMPDGLDNAAERLHETDPRNPDTDGDGIFDGEEVVVGVDGYITNPLEADTDGDTIPDGEEISLGADGFITNPTSSDTDLDGISDSEEVTNGTDPTDGNDPPPPAIPSDSLVILYAFEEGSGTEVKDSATLDGAQDASQNQPDGVDDLLWSTEGLVGNAIELNGSQSLIAPDAIPTDATGFTMSAWVKPRGQGGYKGIYATRVIDGDPNLNWGLNLEGNLHGDLRLANASGSGGVDTADDVMLDEWHHLVLTWTSDGAEAVGKGYLDGIFSGSFNTTDNGVLAIYDSVGTYNIGDDPCCGNREFDGLIDEIAVWTETLDDAQIATIYRNGLAGIGITPPEGVDFRITKIVHNNDGSVDLTWNSDPAPGTDYRVLFNEDLSIPIGNWADADDGVGTMGESTTFTVPANLLTGLDRVFFRIVLND